MFYDSNFKTSKLNLQLCAPKTAKKKKETAKEKTKREDEKGKSAVTIPRPRASKRETVAA